MPDYTDVSKEASRWILSDAKLGQRDSALYVI